tara:strand:+ start:384 stop:821 length:438 start_codon:yes stop_codon:yes gene_type:complete
MEVIMGLDQYGGWLEPQKNKEQEDNVVELFQEEDNSNKCFDWRKHARLQEFMRNLYYSKKNKIPEFGVMGCEFNCTKVFLNKEDVLELQNAVSSDRLPFCADGFFWGQQFQEESMKEYKAQDLEFCKEALKWLEEGKQVYYECWY